MTTFIIYGTDEELINNTISSIAKSTNNEYATLVLKNERDVLDRIILSATSYTMILKAGDTIHSIFPIEYCDVLKPEDVPDDEIRGLRLGYDVIDNLRRNCHTFNDYSDFYKHLSSLYPIYNSDSIKIKLI